MTYFKTGDRIDEYTALWDAEERMTAQPAPVRRGREPSVNAPWPRPWNFQPPRRGWGRQLAALGDIGTDPYRRPSDPDPSYVVVRTWWVQRALNGLRTTRTGLAFGPLVEDGQAGPATMAALEQARSAVVSTRPAVQVPLRDERPMAASGPWASHVAIDARTETLLSTSPSSPVGSGLRPGAPPVRGSSSDVVVGPVTFEEDAPVSGRRWVFLGVLALGGVLFWRWAQSPRR